MASIDTADLPESMLEAKLQRLGLLAPIDVDGVTLPALKVQLTKYNNGAKNISPTDRILCIICNGRGNTGASRFIDTPSFTIVVAGKPDESDSFYAKMIATLIENSLADATQDSCDIFGVVPGGITGPMYDETGRVIYEINGSLLINRF